MPGYGTNINAPLLVGTRPQSAINSPAVSDYGSTVLAQQVTLAVATGTAAVSGTIYVPIGSRVLDIVSNTTTAWNSGSTDVLTVGTAAADTSFASGVSTATTGRVRPTFTAAQLTNMGNVANPAAMVATVTQGGAAATTGLTVVDVTYVPTVQPFVGAT